MMTMSDLHVVLSDYCGEIARLFKNGAKVTILVRNPERDKTELHSAATICSDDTSENIISAIKYLYGKGVPL